MRNVAVVYGGVSKEHEVSSASGEQVLRLIDRSLYRPIPVFIGKDGTWMVAGEKRADPADALLALRRLSCHVAFLALHGPYGEDGRIQGFFETAGLFYTGSGVAASALARDKIRAKRLVAGAGVVVAPDVTLPPADLRTVKERLGFPVVVKNPHEGSTLGIAFVNDDNGFLRAVEELGAGCETLLVERREAGREVTVPILDDASGRPQTLPLVEIRAPGGVFDYRAKYTAGASEEICPAPLPEALAVRIREAALRVHRLLGLRGMSRTDFIVRPSETPVFLEINSIPGLTEQSLLPKSAAAAGIPFADVVTRLVEGAFRPR
jgi:D-alanine-D-alanine ligase